MIHRAVNDNQEIDFELLTTTALTASSTVPAGIWATNQAVTTGGTATDATIPFTFDPSAAYHGTFILRACFDSLIDTTFRIPC